MNLYPSTCTDEKLRDLTLKQIRQDLAEANEVIMHERCTEGAMAWAQSKADECDYQKYSEVFFVERGAAKLNAKNWSDFVTKLLAEIARRENEQAEAEAYFWHTVNQAEKLLREAGYEPCADAIVTVLQAAGETGVQLPHPIHGYEVSVE